MRLFWNQTWNREKIFILAKSKICHLLDTQNTPLKIIRCHIDFIPKIESSKYVEAVCKIRKLLKYSFWDIGRSVRAVLEKYIEVMFKKTVWRWIPISSKLLKMENLENFTWNNVSFEYKITCLDNFGSHFLNLTLFAQKIVVKSKTA
jgi:hypothetical protein